MESNGILAKVPGAYTAQATQNLPPADTATEPVMEVDLEVEHLGRVRFYAERMQVKHGKHTHWFWCVFRAEPIT